MKLLSANWFVHSSVNQCLNLSKPKGYYDHILIIHQKFVDFVEVLRVIIERELSINAKLSKGCNGSFDAKIVSKVDYTLTDHCVEKWQLSK